MSAGPLRAVSLFLIGLVLLAPACKSMAPYTMPSMAINALLAAGASAQARAQGGCFSVCTGDTVCNPRTGYCEPTISLCGKCQPSEGCALVESAWRCVDIGTLSVTQGRSGPALRPGDVAPGVGISPATGRAPPTLPPARPTLDGP